MTSPTFGTFAKPADADDDFLPAPAPLRMRFICSPFMDSVRSMVNL
ncbi:MAG: hypothetical protein R3D34_01565 [Nitratireductor sp.]